MQILLPALGFVLGTILLVLATYFAMRALLAHLIDEDTRDLASSVALRIAALHGLILALVFAQELLRYQSVERTVTKEATAVADIYHDIDRYGDDPKHDIRTALTTYLRVAAGDEWDSLGEEAKLLPVGWQWREAVYQALLDLEPETRRQELLREHMLEDIQTIAATRQAREASAQALINPLFWLAAIGGVILVAASYFSFPPKPVNLVLISLYGAFTGLIMLLIYGMANPFSHPGAMNPNAFEQLLASFST